MRPLIVETEDETSEVEEVETSEVEILKLKKIYLEPIIENTHSEETHAEKENKLASSESYDEKIETHKSVESKDDHIPYKLKNDDGSVIIDNVKDFYRMTLNYENQTLDHAIIIYYDGGKDF